MKGTAVYQFAVCKTLSKHSGACVRYVDPKDGRYNARIAASSRGRRTMDENPTLMILSGCSWRMTTPCSGRGSLASSPPTGAWRS